MATEFRVVTPSDIGQTIKLGALEPDKYDVIAPIQGFSVDNDACIELVTSHGNHQACLAPVLSKFIPEPCPVDATSYKVVNIEYGVGGGFTTNETTVSGVQDVGSSGCKQVVIPQHRASIKLTNVTGATVLGYIHVAEEGYEVV